MRQCSILVLPVYTKKSSTKFLRIAQETTQLHLPISGVLWILCARKIEYFQRVDFHKKSMNQKREMLRPTTRHSKNMTTIAQHN
jgi:hypothetical protein